MPNGRKTVEVVSLIVDLNRAIKRAGSPAEQKGLCFAIEQVLQASGNYAGYTYLENIDWMTADEYTKARVEYGRCYIMSEVVRTEWRKNYTWCPTCEDYHVNNPDMPGRCSWCHNRTAA